MASALLRVKTVKLFFCYCEIDCNSVIVRVCNSRIHFQSTSIVFVFILGILYLSFLASFPFSIFLEAPLHSNDFLMGSDC